MNAESNTIASAPAVPATTPEMRISRRIAVFTSPPGARFPWFSPAGHSPA